MGDLMEIKPIAYIKTDFSEKFGIPRQSGRVKELLGKIQFTPEFSSPDAIRGIDEYSHLWLVFGFSRAEYKNKTMTVRPPRLGGNKRVGIFASRAPFRPNSLGLSCVKLERVEKGVLIVSGIDLLDDTPIYDIKPYIPYSDCILGAKGSFAENNKEHSLEVVFPEEFLNILPEDKQKAAVLCLRDDPRPSYHNDERVYSMLFAGYDIHFTVVDDILTVTGIDKKSL